MSAVVVVSVVVFVIVVVVVVITVMIVYSVIFPLLFYCNSELKGLSGQRHSSLYCSAPFATSDGA